MIEIDLLLAVFLGVTVLLTLVLALRIQAFISLLIACLVVGLVAGMPPLDIVQSMQNGMGGTLGFVATVVGLGSIFGAILEKSGGTQGLAQYLLGRFGEERAPWALVITGFLVAIPVFFDVAFIILVPIVYALQRKTEKSLLLYAIPLLAGLAITHSFIPPTPGPIAVAEIIGADLGAVILIGFIIGIPTSFVAGPLFGRIIARKIHIPAPAEITHAGSSETPPIGLISGIIGIPIILIVGNTVSSNFLAGNPILPLIQLLGHPFTALIIANLLAWYFLGVRRGYSRQELFEISTDSLATAGTIILLTGAGGAFKQLLVDTGSGKMIAEAISSSGMPLLLFSFLVSAVVRILQGSATVAMITAAGLTAPVMGVDLGEFQKALVVIVIASGATILSHVNDSGFWLVNRYLGLTEKQTLQSWTVMETLIALCGLIGCLLLSAFV